jgi:hypothetical protein
MACPVLFEEASTEVTQLGLRSLYRNMFKSILQNNRVGNTPYQHIYELLPTGINLIYILVFIIFSFFGKILFLMFSVSTIRCIDKHVSLR